jgi:acetyl/propionyl-CoA carboxylase alpha subunit
MQRALVEYDVVGVRTSLPFFKWLLAQESFERAAFHTSYLDEVLQRRQGQSFAEPDMSHDEVAAIAAVLSTYALRAPADTSHVPAGALAKAATYALRAPVFGEGPAHGSGDGPAYAAVSGQTRWVRQARHDALRH